MKRFKCQKFDREFLLQWRIEKHKNSYAKVTKYWHYFNNDKVCPYNDIGCMFKHEESHRCKFNEDCKFKLCQFKHIKTSVIHEEHSEQENDDKPEQESKKEDEYKKYDELSDRDQFEVQEIDCESWNNASDEDTRGL